MSSTSDSETEILLGNRHLLAIFFVLAVLLGVAFTGGYMVGRNSTDRKAATAPANADAAASTATSQETHALPPAGSDPNTDAATGTEPTPAALPPPPAENTATAAAKQDAPLGSPKQDEPAPAKAAPKAAPKSGASFAGPESGQTFLQVAAVGRTEAKALAGVLAKKGFQAHAVAKPGSGDLYRVLIGPMRDASELGATRDSLRNAGFTKIFVQKY